MEVGAHGANGRNADVPDERRKAQSVHAAAVAHHRSTAVPHATVQTFRKLPIALRVQVIYILFTFHSFNSYDPSIHPSMCGHAHCLCILLLFTHIYSIYIYGKLHDQHVQCIYCSRDEILKTIVSVIERWHATGRRDNIDNSSNNNNSNIAQLIPLINGKPLKILICILS